MLFPSTRGCSSQFGGGENLLKDRVIHSLQRIPSQPPIASAPQSGLSPVRFFKAMKKFSELCNSLTESQNWKDRNAVGSPCPAPSQRRKSFSNIQEIESLNTKSIRSLLIFECGLRTRHCSKHSANITLFNHHKVPKRWPLLSFLD